MVCHFQNEVIKDADASDSFSLSLSLVLRETRCHSLIIFRHPCGEIHMTSNRALHSTVHGTTMWENSSLWMTADPANGLTATSWGPWAGTTQQTCSWFPNFQKPSEIMFVVWGYYILTVCYTAIDNEYTIVSFKNAYIFKNTNRTPKLVLFMSCFCWNVKGIFKAENCLIINALHSIKLQAALTLSTPLPQKICGSNWQNEKKSKIKFKMPG